VVTLNAEGATYRVTGSTSTYVLVFEGAELILDNATINVGAAEAIRAEARPVVITLVGTSYLSNTSGYLINIHGDDILTIRGTGILNTNGTIRSAWRLIIESGEINSNCRGRALQTMIGSFIHGGTHTLTTISSTITFGDFYIAGGSSSFSPMNFMPRPVVAQPTTLPFILLPFRVCPPTPPLRQCSRLRVTA
jgi:hypothetical protein